MTEFPSGSNGTQFGFIFPYSKPKTFVSIPMNTTKQYAQLHRKLHKYEYGDDEVYIILLFLPNDF